jgi:hypothetical protein
MVSGGTGVATGVGPAASVGTGVLAGVVVPAEPLQAAATSNATTTIAANWNLVRILGSPLGRILCRTLFGATFCDTAGARVSERPQMPPR